MCVDTLYEKFIPVQGMMKQKKERRQSKFLRVWEGWRATIYNNTEKR